MLVDLTHSDVILGLVASVLTAIGMSTTNRTSETNQMLAKLKLWMHSKRLPIGLQVSCTNADSSTEREDFSIEHEDFSVEK